MKKLAALPSVLIIILSSFSNNTATQRNPFPFDVKISGQGVHSIIFIPGFSCSGEVWDETKYKYEKDYTCYTLTMAGFADAKPQPNASFKNWETGIANYIKEHHIEKPILIGHSMGGGLALAIAADYPELIDKIIAVDALPCLAALMNPAFKSKEVNDCSEMVNQIIAVTDEQFYQMQKTTAPMLVADTSKQALIAGWSVQSDRKTFAEMYCDFSNTDLREKIATIKCPVLILLEEYFKNVKPAILEQYKNLKTASLQYAGKGLHFIMYDDKEWYFTQLDNFITSK
jgi:pimeloyl-ACP methyl ester carboxylesterase